MLNCQLFVDWWLLQLPMFAEPQCPEYVALSTTAQKTMSSQAVSPAPELVPMPAREAGIWISMKCPEVDTSQYKGELPEFTVRLNIIFHSLRIGAAFRAPCKLLTDKLLQAVFTATAS